MQKLCHMIATTEKRMTTALICSHPPLTAPTLVAVVKREPRVNPHSFGAAQ